MKLQSIRNRIEYFLATPSGRETAYIAGVVLVIVAGLSLLQTFHVLEKGTIPLSFTMRVFIVVVCYRIVRSYIRISKKDN